MNIKQYMREGRKAEDVLFGEGGQDDNASFQYYDKLPLPPDHVIRYSNDSGDATYTVQRVISQEGSCSITYLVQGALDDYKVLKEFCPKSIGLHRYMIKDAQGRSAKVSKKVKDQKVQVYHDYQLNYDRKDKTISTAWNKFKEEPGRVRDLLDMNSQDWETSARKMHLPVPYGKSFKLHGNWYYLLEVVNGDSLFEYVRKKGEGAITWAQKVSIMQQLCIALNNLHKSSIHMDVSPFNILVKENETDGSIHLTLIDFGLATSIIHQPGFSSLHGEGTDVFTDTKSWLERYKILHGINKEPAPILVVDIFSIGMIWLYLLYADQFHKREKVEMKERLENLKFNIGANIETADTEWMKDALQLADDSISYDDTRQTDADIRLDGYGPFHKRPKTAEEWFRRLDVIDNKKTQSEKPSVTVNSDTPLQMPAYNDKEAVKLFFETNGNWQARCDPKWLHGGLSDGTPGKHNLSLTADPNKGMQHRDTKLTITTVVGGVKATEEVVIKQPGCGIELVDGQSFEFLSNGEEKKLKFKAGGDCTWRWLDNPKGWLKIENPVKQDGVYQLTLSAGENKSGAAQKAVLEINCLGNVQQVEFTQPRLLLKPFVKLLTKKPLVFPANDVSQTVSLSFNTNANWSAWVAGPWRIVSGESGGAGKGEVQLIAAPNMSLDTLTGDVIIEAYLDGNKHTEKVPCSQPACGIEIEPKPTLYFPAGGGTGELRYKAGGVADVRVDGVDSGWLENTGEETEKGWQVIRLKANANTENKNRFATVCINCSGNEESRQFIQQPNIPVPVDKVKIRDNQQSCFPADRGTYYIEFDATGPWYAYIDGNPGWVTIKNFKGTGSGKLQLQVNKNTSTFDRENAKLVIALDNGKAADFITLSQKGRIDTPIDWQAIWQKARVAVYVLGVALAVWGGYRLWWWQKPVLALHDGVEQVVSHDATAAGWDFFAKGDWTVEVGHDGHWVTVVQDKGEAGSHRLSFQFDENGLKAERRATIRLSCQDRTETLTLIQQYDLVYWLNKELADYRERYEDGNPAGFDKITSRLDRKNYMHIFRRTNGEDVGNMTNVIKGKVEDCLIGKTHKVVGFKLNEDSLFTEIIVAPINE